MPGQIELALIIQGFMPEGAGSGCLSQNVNPRGFRRSDNRRGWFRKSNWLRFRC